MNVTIRRLTDADAEVIARAFAEIGWNKSEAKYRWYVAQQQAQHLIALVAEREADFAGYLTIVWEPAYAFFKAQGIPEIQDLNVLPKHRRCGVATALMDEAEALVGQRCRRVGIGVGLHPGYNAAQRLYGLRGYVPDGQGVIWQGAFIRERQTVVADDDLILHLVKELSAV